MRSDCDPPLLERCGAVPCRCRNAVLAAQGRELAGLRLAVATAEDVLIAKLEWRRWGESERQIEDAASIVRIKGDSLDTLYVERWVAELDLIEQWRSAKARAV
jgi:hypothetical protein